MNMYNCLRSWVTPLKLSAVTRSLKWCFPAIYLLIAAKDIVRMVQYWYYPKCGVMLFCCLNGCSIYIPTGNIPQITTLVEHKRQNCAKFQLSTTNSKDMAMQGVKKKVVNTPSYGKNVLSLSPKKIKLATFFLTKGGETKFHVVTVTLAT